MFKTHNPIPGYWYSMQPANHLIQVRAKVYTKDVITSIVLEDIDGVIAHITPAEWVDMNLILHSPVTSYESTA